MELLLPIMLNKFETLLPLAEQAGVETLHFVDIPSHIAQTAPYFLENRFAPDEDLVREAMMSLRAFDYSKKGPVVLKVGKAHVPRCYKTLSLLESNPAASTGEERGHVFERLCQLLDEYQLEPITKQETTQDTYNQLAKQMEHAYNTMLITAKEGGNLEPLVEQALNIGAALSFASYDIHRRAFAQSPETLPLIRISRGKLMRDYKVGLLERMFTE